MTVLVINSCLTLNNQLNVELKHIVAYNYDDLYEDIIQNCF